MLQIRRLLLIIGLVVFLVCGSMTIGFPAAAILRQHHESPGVLRYHAHSTLRDRQGLTWQVILFPEAQSESTTKYHLRLVGFPGTATFIHPQPLEIIPATGQVLDAVDLFTVDSLAPNVGEYDLTEILPLLPEKGSLKLAIILQGDRNLSLKIPESTVIEWQWLIQ